MFGGRKTQSSQALPSESSADQQSLVAPSRQPVGYETVLGANTHVKGELKSKANVRIDGNFEGSLEIEGNILVGETARVVADIRAQNEVRIAGAVRGNINGRKVYLGRTGRVWGDINSKTLIADEGAFIDGKITMNGHPAGAQGFGPALPAPDISVLGPMEEPVEGEPVEAELLGDDDSPGESGDD